VSSIIKQHMDRNKATSGGKLVMVVFFLIFSVAGLVMAYFFLFPLLKNLISARNWEKVPCTIVSGRVLTHEDSDGDTYSIEIEYKYLFENRAYISNRYNFNKSSSSGYSSKKAIVDKYPPGINTFCYVNPHMPNEAVIDRDFNISMLIMVIFPLIFTSVGFIPLLFFLKNKNVNVIPSVSGSSEVVLKSKTSPLTRLLGVLIVAIFWNGIIIIPLSQIYQGRGETCLTLFMIPFSIVGIGLIIGVIYYVLCLFNPRPKLILSSSPVPMGKEVTVWWKVSGNTYVMKDFHIYLEGREEATYTRGTDSVTDKEVFSTINIFDTENPEYMKEGSAGFTIPSDSMHTFDAPHNKVLWHIHLNSKINYWPDIKEEYEIMVFPENLIKKGFI